MKKIAKIEEQKNHLLYEFLEKLNKEVPSQSDNQKIEEAFVHQYKLLVNMSFSANILYKGLDYAAHLYNHIAKIEYSRLRKMIIKQKYDQQTTERILKRIKKAQHELLQQSPLVKKSEGIDIFYGFTGGNRQKYKSNRKAIKQMYKIIKQTSKRNLTRFLQDTWNRNYQKLKMKKDTTLWLVKSYTWR
ncbi:hypothetical protein [Enterococcus termitis]|jgi:Glu-tRNA(Gln) amidotransferase subunit E-like FAD-binding protein|uniref:Uncharacterized protein n=1 Tax=Enterococcus termitis TaxID=332950 RepID=A0A1E5GHM9_9ENTE|nr:hypothetical protein [Enterococcus termitis]OEG12218.1 hypothetical protein BCR25_06640 [Enterococcus termitis]OJG98973.1 hypothetical protein RV18_GL002835 [Enterococcus termitis]